jgi:NitT/TauT family transport system permease protein
MGTQLVDAPAEAVAPARAKSGSLALAAVQVLAPVLAAAAVLALHNSLKNKRDLSLWIEALPAWEQPLPLVVAVIIALSVLFLLVQTVLPAARKPVRHFAPLIAGLTLLLGVWDLTTLKFDKLSQTFFPAPDEVFGAMYEDRVILLESVEQSLRLLVAGYLAGVFAGITTGVLVGWFPRIRYWGLPALKLVGPVPATALIPVVMTIWKDSFPGSVALIGFAVWFPVTMLTASGIANVRVSYLDVARTLGAGPLYLIFRVAIPAALPNIFLGLFMGLGASFLTLVVAEALGVQAGLGWYINWRQGAMEYAPMYGALILSAAFFSTIMTLLFKVRERVLRWQKGVIMW